VNEIEGLARAFIAEAAREATRQPTLSRDALVALERYSWPGNIRELRNVIERAVLLAGDDGAILPDHLPLDKMRSTMSVRSVTTQPARDVRDAPSSGFAIRHPSGAYAQGRPFTPEEPTNEWPAVFYPEESPSRSARGLRDELEALERQRILDALERCGGNQTQAARLLGISRGTLLSRLNQYDVTRPRKPRR
jgi:DNA-binding NtrC family response regulator